MISVNFIADANDRIVAVTLCGHAQSVDRGIDPLCAAVTGIMTYFVNTLKETMRLQTEVKASDPGEMSVRISESDLDKAQDLLHGLKLQFSDYEKQYPGSIRVTVSK